MATQPPRYDGSDSGPIDLATAQTWIQNFTSKIPPTEVRSHYFGRWIIDKILRQQDCCGLQIYYALDDSGAKQLLLVGVDSKGNIMRPDTALVGSGNTIGDASIPCPTFCPNGGL
jgi:hypothetical protein